MVTREKERDEKEKPERDAAEELRTDNGVRGDSQRARIHIRSCGRNQRNGEQKAGALSL